MMNIGIVYSSKGDLDRALRYCMDSQQIRYRLGLQNTAGYALLLSNMGLLYEKRGDKGMAGRYPVGRRLHGLNGKECHFRLVSGSHFSTLADGTVCIVLDINFVPKNVPVTYRLEPTASNSHQLPDNHIPLSIREFPLFTGIREGGL